METLHAPALVASGLLFTSENRLPVQLRAESDGVLLSFSKKEFLGLMAQSSDFMQFFLYDMGNKFAFLAERLRIQQFSNLRQKIAAYFLKLHKLYQSTEIHLKYSLETLADLFGASRPSLSRSLSEMIKEEFLEKRASGRYAVEPASLHGLLP